MLQEVEAVSRLSINNFSFIVFQCSSVYNFKCNIWLHMVVYTDSTKSKRNTALHYRSHFNHNQLYFGDVL